MLPSVGFAEMLLLAVLALIVVGPRDLPLLMRKAGRILGRLRALGNEFRDSMDELGRQAELEELREESRRLREMNTELTRQTRLDVDEDGKPIGSYP